MEPTAAGWRTKPTRRKPIRGSPGTWAANPHAGSGHNGSFTLASPTKAEPFAALQRRRERWHLEGRLQVYWSELIEGSEPVAEAILARALKQVDARSGVLETCESVSLVCMTRGEVRRAMPALIDKWAAATRRPMPPDPRCHYSFSTFYSWIEQNHSSYTRFRAMPNARSAMEMWFNEQMSRLGAIRCNSGVSPRLE
jgi:hypothetical protein